MKSQAYNAHITMFLNFNKTIQPQWAFLEYKMGPLYTEEGPIGAEMSW